MPSFTTRIADLQQLGPVIDVIIAVPLIVAENLKKEGKIVPAMVRVSAMIDTGATSSVITPYTVNALGLSPVGTANINTPSCESYPTYQYHVLLGLPNTIPVETTEAVMMPLSGQHIQCLIGRDALKNAVFIYNGYAETITFSL